MSDIYIMGILLEISGQKTSTKLLRLCKACCFITGLSSLSIDSNPDTEFITLAIAKTRKILDPKSIFWRETKIWSMKRENFGYSGYLQTKL